MRTKNNHITRNNTILLNRKSKHDVAVMANPARMKKIGTEIVYALTPVGADARVSNDYTDNLHAT